MENKFFLKAHVYEQISIRHIISRSVNFNQQQVRNRHLCNTELNRLMYNISYKICVVVGICIIVSLPVVPGSQYGYTGHAHKHQRT